MLCVPCELRRLVNLRVSDCRNRAYSDTGCLPVASSLRSASPMPELVGATTRGVAFVSRGEEVCRRTAEARTRASE